MSGSPRTASRIPTPNLSTTHGSEKDSSRLESHPDAALRAPHSTPVHRFPDGSHDSPQGATPIETPSPPSPATPVDQQDTVRPKKKKKRSGLKEKASTITLANNRPLFQSFKPNILLENSGSVARDHLASERTYLAYVRTSLVLATTGVALVQLFAVARAQGTTDEFTHVQKFARPLGATLIIFGLLVLFSGVRRYFAIQNALIQGNFPITRVEITAIAVVLAVIVIIFFGVLVSPHG